MNKPELTLIHGIEDKGNRNWQKNDSVELRPGIGFGKRDNGYTGTRQQDGTMHPRKKGTFVGKENFGFDLDGDFSFSDQSSDLSVWTGRGAHGLVGMSKETLRQAAEETAARATHTTIAAFGMVGCGRNLFSAALWRVNNSKRK
jgi:hypothetical protein